MPTPSPESSESIVWARKVNSRWIVHHGLGESADAYIRHLEVSDPDRLIRSCQRARQLVRSSVAGEDPKPWFYAGLFSLATESEAKQFLDKHWFTRNCIPTLAERISEGKDSTQLGEESLAKITRVRETLNDIDHTS